jgi:hypothetical protein
MWFMGEQPEKPLLPAPIEAPAAASRSTFGAAHAHYLYIYGKKDQGKTVYLRDAYRAAIASGARGIFMDTTGRNGDLGHVATTVQEVAAAFTAGHRSVVYQQGWNDSPSELFAWIFQLGDVVLAADEAQSFAGPGSANRDFLKLNQLGRNAQVSFMTTAQGPTDLHPKVRQNFDAVVCFCSGIPLYANTLATDFFRKPQIAPLLLQIPQYHYLRVTNDAEAAITRGEIDHPWDQPQQLPRAA